MGKMKTEKKISVNISNNIGKKVKRSVNNCQYQKKYGIQNLLFWKKNLFWFDQRTLSEKS